MQHNRARILALAAMVASLPGAWAQTVHVLTEPPAPVPGDEVRVRLVRGDPFGENASPLSPAGIQRLWRSGRSRLAPSEPGLPATFEAAEPGIQLLAWASPAGERSIRGVESFGKALVVVGRSEPGERIWRSELGQRLEIVPRTDPAALVRRGGPFEVQVLLDREPLASVTVVAVAEGATSESYAQRTTDALGRARFDLDRPGRWLIQLAHKAVEPAGDDGAGSGWVLLQSSLVVTAGPAEGS